MTSQPESNTTFTPDREAEVQGPAPTVDSVATDEVATEAKVQPEPVPETQPEIETQPETQLEPETPEAIIAQLTALLTEANERNTRLLADFDNLRKRTQRDKEELTRHVTENVLKALLNIFDDIDRAKEAADKSDNIEKLREGFQGVYKNFLTTLEKLGVRRMDVIGQPFDSEVHEAIGAVPVEDEAQKGTVVNVLKHGYLYNERVLRIAQVLTGE